MTTPVNTDNLVQGAVKYLLSFSDVTDVLGTTTDGNPLLFQDELYARMEGTQSTAAVVSLAGGWAGPNQHNTMRFPRLSLELWADPRRDDGNNELKPGETRRRIDNAYQVIDRYLHRPQSGTQMWGTVRTITCTRLVEPLIYAVPDGNGLLRLQVFYGVAQG